MSNEDVKAAFGMAGFWVGILTGLAIMGFSVHADPLPMPDQPAAMSPRDWRARGIRHGVRAGDIASQHGPVHSVLQCSIRSGPPPAGALQAAEDAGPMSSVAKRVEKILADAGFARAGESGRGRFVGPGFCTGREREAVLVGYIGPDGEAVQAEDVQRRLSVYASVLLAEGFQVDRVSGAYHCLRVSPAAAAEPSPQSDAA